MFTEDIAEKVLMNPLREGADELYVAGIIRNSHDAVMVFNELGAAPASDPADCYDDWNGSI